MKMIRLLISLLILLQSHICLAGVSYNPERDDDGAVLARLKITKTGWFYQMSSFQMTTCKRAGYTDITRDGDDPGFLTIKFYNSSDVELIQDGGETDQQFQTELDNNCVKTVLDWTPDFTYEILGGHLRIISAPPNPVRLWITALPGIADKDFVVNLDLRFISPNESIVVDGRSPKILKYNDPIPGTNTLRYQFVSDDVGYKQEMQVSMEYFTP